MDDTITQIAKQVPSLGVLVFIVWVFLKHNEKRDDAIKSMHIEHMEARVETRTCIRENSKSNEEQRAVMLQISNNLDGLTQFLKKNNNA